MVLTLTVRKIDASDSFQIEYDHIDNFSFDYELNKILFGSCGQYRFTIKRKTVKTIVFHAIRKESGRLIRT